MRSKQNILAISGSTRQNSSNNSLLKAIEELTKDFFDITIFGGLESLPHFNPDNNLENVPEEVIHFRQLLNNAEGVIIVPPSMHTEFPAP